MNLKINSISFEATYKDVLANDIINNVWVIRGPIISWGYSLESAIENYQHELSEYYEIMDK